MTTFSRLKIVDSFLLAIIFFFVGLISLEARFSYIKYIDDLIEIAAKQGTKIPSRSTLKDTLQSVPVEKLDQVRKLVDQHRGFLQTICTNTKNLDFVLENPQYANAAIKTLKSFPSGYTLNTLKDFSSSSKGLELCDNLLSELRPNEIEAVVRMMAGNTYSSKTLQRIIDKSKHLPSETKGEFFEIVGAKILANGRRFENVEFKKGSKLIDGKFDNNNHGIDKIGVSPNGEPVLLELSINKSLYKKHPKPFQMSPEWCADRWNKLLEANPQKINELIEMGMNPKYNKNLSYADFTAGAIQRKIVLPKDGPIVNSEILKAGLDPLNDIVRL